MEVLRDGASANYGSDAIAGVLNFRLRDDREGATFIARYGQYYKGDGEDYLLQGNVGLPFTPDGFVNISGEYSNSGITSRQNQRPDAQIGRASCGERVCQYVSFSVVAVSLQKKKNHR